MGRRLTIRIGSACSPFTAFLPTTILGMLFALVSPAYGTDTIVIGRAVDNSYAGTLTDSYNAANPCPPDSICMDGIYRWVINSMRIVAGPTLKRHIIALDFQHIGVNADYLKSLRLFVLRPIGEVEISHLPGDRYYLVSPSPVYEDGSFCISVDPSASGLRVKNVTKRNDGSFCFDHRQLE